MSLINTRLATPTVLTAGATIPVGTVIHKAGCAITAGANSIRVSGAGFYRIIANVTVEPTAVADMVVSLLDNGTVIATATETPAVAGDAVNLTLIAFIYNRCECNEDAISLTVNSAGTVTEADIIIEKV